MKLPEFKRIIGVSADEIAKAIGYSREGLYRAFAADRNNERFNTLIYGYVDDQISEEIARHEDRMQELNGLKSEYKPQRVRMKEMDSKVHFLSERRAR